METKPKKCKGQARAVGFKGCGKNTVYRKYGLCPSCLSDWMFGTDDGKLYMQRQLLWKVQKPRKDLEKAFREKKERTGLTTIIKHTVDTFHRYVRERDKGKPCIACATPWKHDFQASHYYKAELYTTLRFNENNVFGGCMECNLRKEGNLSEFVLNIPKRIGNYAFEELNRLAEMDKRTDHKWDREKLREIRIYYNQKLKELKL